VQCSGGEGSRVQCSAVEYMEWTILMFILINISLQGEEINVGIRGFTHGYDFYAPRDSVVFHEYAQKSSRRKKIPMFW
jgi:Glycosyltransferase (GlcNAc)